MIIIAHILFYFFFIVIVFVVLRFHSSITTQKLNTLVGFYANTLLRWDQIYFSDRKKATLKFSSVWNFCKTKKKVGT